MPYDRRRAAFSRRKLILGGVALPALRSGQSPYNLVIPNRAESPVRNPLSADATANPIACWMLVTSRIRERMRSSRRSPKGISNVARGVNPKALIPAM